MAKKVNPAVGESKEEPKFEVTYAQVQALYNAINDAKNQRVGMGVPTFRTTTILNKGVCKPIIDIITEANTPSKDLDKYREEFAAIQEKYGEKSIDGRTLKRYSKPYGKGEEVVDPNEMGYYNYLDLQGFRNESEELDKKYDAVIEEEKKRPELVADILKTKVKLSFKTFQSLPADVTWDLEEVLREIGLINS